MTNLIAAADSFIANKILSAPVPPVQLDIDPTSGINEIGKLIQNVVTAAGIILILFGFVQIGVSISQHDSQQRINGFLFLAGGIIVASAPTIMTTIGIDVPWA